mgnify:CR=1 FL=1
MIRIKICGMQSVEDVATCVSAGADALGFIFAGGPRRLTIERAAELTASVPPSVTCVGVFADTPAETIRAAIARCRLDVLQFAGDESATLRGSFGRPTIAVTRGQVPDTAELAQANAIAVLVDGASGNLRGGTATLVDVELARSIRSACGAHLILAGGLTPANVAGLILEISPDGVDVRSGVEVADRKDPLFVRAFVRAAKGALRAGT